MKILVFDTETTGFINKKNPSLDAQPYIIQFAGILGEYTNGVFQEIERKDILINPGAPIPYGASQVHHIYDIDVKDSPAMLEVIDDITQFLAQADIIVGHNIEYDENMLHVELRRYQKQHQYQPNQVICTMKSTVDFCQLQGNGLRFKYPKLGELYKKLFGEYFIGAHDAMTDVEATLKAFLELVNQDVIILGNTKDEVLSLF